MKDCEDKSVLMTLQRVRPHDQKEQEAWKVIKNVPNVPYLPYLPKQLKKPERTEVTKKDLRHPEQTNSVKQAGIFDELVKSQSKPKHSIVRCACVMS